MALGLSPTVMNSVLNWLYRGTAFPAAPGVVAISLHTGAGPGSTGANECPNSNGYVRVDVRPYFGAAAAAGSVANTILIPLFTPSGTFAAPVTWLGVWSSVTYGAGTFYGGGDIVDFTPTIGQPYDIPIGDLLAALT